LTTAVELTEEELDRIRDRLGRILEGKEVILETNLDPDLVGGAVFSLGGRRIDGSVRGQLLNLRDRMLERGAV